MTSDAQSQPVLINWEPLFNSPLINITEKCQGVTIGRALGGYARNGARMARAAENVARWKTYLPEECVRVMMTAGWHWST
jgi:hypothetical protein